MFRDLPIPDFSIRSLLIGTTPFVPNSPLSGLCLVLHILLPVPFDKQFPVLHIGVQSLSPILNSPPFGPLRGSKH